MVIFFSPHFSPHWVFDLCACSVGSCCCSLAAPDRPPDLWAAISGWRWQTVTNPALSCFLFLSNIYHFSSFLQPLAIVSLWSLPVSCLFCTVMHSSSVCPIACLFCSRVISFALLTCLRSCSAPVHLPSYFSHASLHHCRPIFFSPISVFCRVPMQNGMFYTSYVSTYLPTDLLFPLVFLWHFLQTIMGLISVAFSGSPLFFFFLIILSKSQQYV